MTCVACRQKPAIIGKPILYLDCYNKWWQTEVLDRQAKSKNLSTLLLTMKYIENMIAEQIGFPRPSASLFSVNHFDSCH
ncbi:MAG: hypothetical protein A3E87_10770 [Gammaproteobacteria bacterium RIFCSPHIGHO2_12_FULL_35_23]|nr:MAG: hypothetical protein A3E87_10770 [Gammaproteobacteria bacterium RIFCSPHIGHO2_12_FULL_35_23]